MKPMRILSLVPLCLVIVAGYVDAERTPIPDAQVVPWTEKRVTEWEPKASERRFDEIGWAKDIRTARQLAQSSQRPVFIFTMDGRINIGRF